MRINLTREDVLAGKILPPAWYKVVVKDVTAEPSKTDGSTNYWFKFVVVEGPYSGVPLRKNFSEKWMAPISGLIESLIGKPYEGGEVELDSAVGKTVMIKTINKEYQGRMQNDIEGYKAA